MNQAQRAAFNAVIFTLIQANRTIDTHEVAALMRDCYHGKATAHEVLAKWQRQMAAAARDQRGRPS